MLGQKVLSVATGSMRIASLISSGTEMLYALGLADQVVAVSHECDWPSECRRLPRVTRSRVNSLASSRAIDEEVRHLLAKGMPLYEVNMGALAELKPDLIITQAQCDVCAVCYDDVMTAVRTEPALRSCHVMSLNPRSLGDVLEEMIGLGEAAGIHRQAREVVAELRRRTENIRRSTLSIAKRLRVAIIEWTDPLMLAGNWTPQLVDLAGGRCELTTPGEPSRAIELDELRVFDPEVIVVCPCGFDQHRAATEVELLAQYEHWGELMAVKREQVVAINGNSYFNRPGPRLVDSLELLAGLLHQAL